MNERQHTFRVGPRSCIGSVTPHRAASSTGAGFTLLEMLLAAAILAVAIALVISAFAGSARFARDRATELQLRSLDVAVQQFQSDYGFLPPLIDPGANPSAGGAPKLADYDRTFEDSASTNTFDVVGAYPNRPLRDSAPYGRLRVFGSAGFDNGDEESVNNYLRYKSFADVGDALNPRYSYLSLGSYLLGTLPKQVDGGSESLMGRPTPDGRFDETREKRAPAMDAASLSDNKLVRRRSFNTANTGGTVDPRDATLSIIVDRNLMSVRYYRWEPLYHTADNAAVVPGRAGASPNNSAQAGQVRDENVPYVLGYSKNINVGGVGLDAVADPNGAAARAAIRLGKPYQTLASQRYAIVAAGPDSKFGGGTNDFYGTIGVREAKDNLIITAGNLVSPEDTR